jgi:hypothetical protein
VVIGVEVSGLGGARVCVEVESLSSGVGDAAGVSRYVDELRRGQRRKAEKLMSKITDIRV